MNIALPASATISTPLRTRLLNIFASPGEVFEEIVAAPPRAANWRVPTLLVCLAGIILLQVAAPEMQLTAKVPLEQTQMLAGLWPIVSCLSVCVAAFAGTFWSAFVLWAIGRWFLNVRFSYLKALEVVGLTAAILVLGTIVTTLLVAASGDATARPALSLLAGKMSAGTARQLLETLNIFHIWATTVLAIGLSKLSGVTFKEAAFWVFGYWLLIRIALIILA